MIKRIFSNKSGFTLVEIVIAFAVFAIMAAAIMQILNLVSYERSENAKFLATLEAQEEKLAADGKQEFEKQDGEVVLNFKDTTANNISYDMKAANGDEEGVGDGLVYFVSEKSAEGGEAPTQPGNTGNKAGEQGQMSAVDARITGSPNFDIIKIEQIKKAGSEYKGDGVCYYIQLYASTLTMTEEEQKYAQFKLNFFMSDAYEETEQYEDGDAKAYTRMEYQKANILDAGYVNASSLDSVSTSDLKSVVKEKNISSGSTNNPFYVTKLTENTIRISSPYANSDDTVKFSGQKIRLYVAFDKDPNLTFASFGHNGATTGIFKPCPIWKETYNADGTCKYETTGKTSNYIYGANMYKRNYK